MPAPARSRKRGPRWALCYHCRVVRRLAPALLLAAYGGAFAFAAFGRGLPAFDDHPGQYVRLWHLLERSLPGGRWTADWSPDWWGGYPELQFYPPGLALAGAALRLLALWQPTVEAVYCLLAALALLLPALATYLLLARVLEDAWLALPPAFLALTLSAGLGAGVEAGVRWGMLGGRLALGCLPLLCLALRGFVDHGRLPRWAPPLAAFAVLAHPASLPAVLAVLAAATGLGLLLRPGREPLYRGLATAGLAALLAAFWLLPFAARRAWVVPLAWGEPTLAGLAAEAWARPLLVVILVGAPLAWVAVALRRRPFDALVAALPVLLLAVVALDAPLFAAGWSAVEPARLHDGLVLAALLATGLGAGALAERLLAGPSRGRARIAAALGTTVLLVAAAAAEGRPPRGASGQPTLTLWPATGAWPTLDELTRAHGLDQLWTALRGPSDRVLFVTSALRLDRDPAWYAPHSHVLALTPLLAGREIVNGTFTHPSPVAARFYTGEPEPPRRLTTLVERLDGRLLLGQPWERLPPERFEAFARRLRVATVVVPAGDARRARFLGEGWTQARDAAGFAIFERRDAEPPWPRVERISPRRYRVLLSPRGGVWVPTGIPAYPGWTVKSRQGVLPTRADPWGLLEFRVPLDVFEAELVYGEGWLEWLALLMTAVGAGVWLYWAGRARPAPVTARGRGSSRSALARRRR
jgi:hypothetical protein